MILPSRAPEKEKSSVIPISIGQQKIHFPPTLFGDMSYVLIAHGDEFQSRELPNPKF
jgi:hypothetical protein